jgi:TrmH family RNA methyltransferase
MHLKRAKKLLTCCRQKGIPVALLPVITKAQVKDIRSLATAKGRLEQGAFLVEGDKLAREWLTANAKLRHIIGLSDWLDGNQSLLKRHPEAQVLEISETDLARIATQQSPNAALLVAEIPPPPPDLPTAEWCIVLDTIQDPGNLGAIIRIADWFGIKHVVCSPGCADYYNPKVVAAAMGGHLRVHLHTAFLPLFLKACTMHVLAATLNGTPMAEVGKHSRAALVIGNESRGVSEDVLACVSGKVTIPKKGGAESLNAAVATGILVSALGPA